MVDLSAAPWLLAPRSQLVALQARGAHGLLLHGPAGTGKWDLALAFAQYLLCDRRCGTSACGACAACRLLAAGNHPDLRVVVPDALAERRPGTAGAADAADTADLAAGGSGVKAKPSAEIKIDQVRLLDTLSGVSAHRGGKRAVVLGPAEALNLHAAHALLKGLEEPPPGLVFILVADKLDACLPTICSRCALVRVPVPGRAAALAWLHGQGLAQQDAAQRLIEAGGAPMGALRGATPGLEHEVRETLLRLLRCGADLDAADLAAQLPRTVQINAAALLMQRWGWDYFSFRLGGALRYYPAEHASFAQLAYHWSLERASAWLDELRDMRRSAEHPLNARLAVEVALLRYRQSVRSGGLVG